MEQSFEAIEYIFVDDCSTDRSLFVLNETLSEYPCRNGCVRIVALKNNRGAAAARKTGLKYATGAYVGFCDSDDWVAPQMYETLYRLSVLNNYDITTGSYFEVKKNDMVVYHVNVPDAGNGYVLNLLDGTLNSFLWNKLFRRELFDGIIIKEGADLWEDMLMCVQLFHKAGNVGFYDGEPMYYYSKINSEAMTNKMTSHNVDSMIENVRLLDSFLLDSNSNIDKKYTYFWKIRCKSLMMAKNHRIDEWNSIFPEVNNRLTDSTGIKWYVKLGAWLLNRELIGFYKAIFSPIISLKCSIFK